MRKMLTFVAVVALAACDSATASNREVENGRGAQAQAPAGASFSGGASHRAAIASVRLRVAGTPALYTARAVSTDGGEVTVEIRSSTGGFSALTSGTFEDTDTGTGEANQDFQATAGTRYLIIAYPSSGGGATLDATHASFIEIEP